MTRRTTHLVLDDIFLCWADSGISRLWRAIVREWERTQLPRDLSVDITVLNRSGRLATPGLQQIPFPSRSWEDRLHAADRETIDRVCESLGADVFVSTYATFPLRIPSLTIVYDLIPERLEFVGSGHNWIERRLSLAVGRRFLAISESTKKDLLHFYPWMDSDSVCVAHPGIDQSLFTRGSQDVVNGFRSAHGLDRDYLVLPGTRGGMANYKNGRIVFDMLRHGGALDYDLVLTGGEPMSEVEIEACKRSGVRGIRLALNDSEYVACLSGAKAVVYPSLHEGFGLPPLEALAVGTPVVTSGSESLRESTGDLAVTFGDGGPTGLRRALDRATSPEWSTKISIDGPLWARQFGWESLARAVLEQVIIAADDGSPSDDTHIGNILADYQDVSTRLQ